MRSVGRINREIYRCITDDIASDDVIITGKQIQHILARHPGDYERIAPFFDEALRAPDYILEDEKHPANTGLILKLIRGNGVRFQMVLRLKTSSDPTAYKSSVISAWCINEDRWNNYVNNKTILYKRE